MVLTTAREETVSSVGSA